MYDRVITIKLDYSKVLCKSNAVTRYFYSVLLNNPIVMKKLFFFILFYFLFLNYTIFECQLKFNVLYMTEKLIVIIIKLDYSKVPSKSTVPTYVFRMDPFTSSFMTISLSDTLFTSRTLSASSSLTTIPIPFFLPSAPL